MDNVTSIALSRLLAQERTVDVFAGNIANADTPGYRAERMQFSDWLVQEPTGGEPPGGSQLIYTQDRATWRDQAAGPLTHTGNPLDLAVGAAEGWFTVATANGTRLTRAGHFQLSAGGDIVDADGNALLDTGGQKLTLTLAPNDGAITVAGDGTLSTARGPIGKIGVVRPDTTTGMTGEGGRLYALPAGDAAQPLAAPHLVQGAVEGSNVRPIAELTSMLQTEREFQFTTQLVQTQADMQQAAIDKILPAQG